jgi:hypothetical protein
MLFVPMNDITHGLALPTQHTRFPSYSRCHSERCPAQVCAAWFAATAALCCALPALATEQVSGLAAALVALDERDSAALAAAWEAALCLACAVPVSQCRGQIGS